MTMTEVGSDGAPRLFDLVEVDKSSVLMGTSEDDQVGC